MDATQASSRLDIHRRLSIVTEESFSPLEPEQIAARARDMGPREQQAFIDYFCDADAALKSQVMHLLAQDAEASGSQYWQHDLTDDNWSPSALLGARLGVYQLQTLLGSGGMGEVYLATRRDGEFTQQVAIKLVRRQLLSEEVRSRLRTERQILATLQHPNIATLLDGGTAPDGTPYLVMEYIDGIAIDVYCDRQQLTLEQRLQLFRKVCAAVQCAHQNLIVHRDLKPSNILVTAEGEPKLLDFGIAKLLDTPQQFDDVTVTQYGYRVMTPAHAAPEQVRGETVTTASDLYVLGVVLYELLCGRRPFVLPPQCRLADVEKLVCQTTPPLLHEQLQRSQQLFPEQCRDIVQSRGATYHKLLRQLQDDLNNIVMMAMRKEPERRYATALQLSDDIERWLSGRPVLATRDSWSYRTGKFLHRHALATFAVTAVVAVLSVFSLITYQQARSIAKQRDAIAVERTRAEQISSFLVELFEYSDPAQNRGNELKARELLDVGARRINHDLQTQPETRATLLNTIGRVYGSLGLYAEASTALQQALQTRSQLANAAANDIVQNQTALADSWINQGKLDEAEQLLQQVLHNLEQQPNVQQDTRALSRAPVLYELGRMALERGNYRLAEQQLRAALQSYEQHQQAGLDKATTLSELGKVLSEEYREAEAEPLYRAALAIASQQLGFDHPRVAELQSRLADALEGLGNYVEAGSLFRTALDTKRQVLGSEHPLTVEALENYGNFLRRNGDYAQAQAVLTEALQTNRKLHGEQHQDVGYDRVNLGLLHYDRGEFEDAASQFRAALDIYQRTLEPDNLLIAGALIGMARAQTQLSRADQALPLLERAERIADTNLGENNAVTLTARAALGLALLAQHKTAAALAELQAAQHSVEATYGDRAVITRELHTGIAQLQASARRN